MNAISLQTALKLIRYNTDSEVATILQAALDELDRLARVERQAVNLARSLLEGRGLIPDLESAWEIVKLTNTQIAEPPSNADWQAANRMATKG